MAELKHLRAAKELRKGKHVLVKFNVFEHQKAQKMADRFTQGNLSEWLRYASQLQPNESDILGETTDAAAP